MSKPGKKGADCGPPAPALSAKAVPVPTKAELKEQKRLAEVARLALRDAMETMTLTDEDEKNAFARLQTSSRAKELELGGGGATRDSFGNTLNKSQQQTKQKEKELMLTLTRAAEKLSFC